MKGGINFYVFYSFYNHHELHEYSDFLVLASHCGVTNTEQSAIFHYELRQSVLSFACKQLYIQAQKGRFTKIIHKHKLSNFFLLDVRKSRVTLLQTFFKTCKIDKKKLTVRKHYHFKNKLLKYFNM